MDQKPYPSRLPVGQSAIDISEARRTFSAAETRSLTNYKQIYNFSLECLVAGAWSHLLGLFTQAERVSVSFASRTNASQIPCGVDGTVGQWLSAVAESLKKESPAENGNDCSYTSSRRGIAGAIASANSIIVVGETPRVPITEREGNAGLLVRVSEAPELTLSVAGSEKNFNIEALDMLVDCLACILAQFPSLHAEPVSKLVLISDKLRSKYLAAPYDLRPASPDSCINKAIEEQCRRNPDEIAAVFNDEQITFRDLDERSTQLARYLKYLGAAPDMPIAAHFGRSIDLLIALLGIVKCGAAFVPLDSLLPAGRVESVMTNSGSRIAITTKRLAARFDHGKVHVISLDAEDAEWKKESTVPFDAYTRQEHLAYVAYTSGSTGTPKGVMIERGHLAAFFSALDNVVSKTPGVWLAIAGVSFDISVVELLWTLSRGFKVVLHEGDEGLPLLTGRQSALAQIVRHGVTHLQGTPTLIRMLVQDAAAPTAFSQIQKIFLGGEPLPPDLASELASLIPGQVINGYGPTETTICATYHVVGNVGTAVPIGKPLLNATVYVVDKWGRRLPPLAPGELLIGGRSIARGYLGRPDLTAERFAVSPFEEDAGGRLYRTGDLVHFNLDGTLDFLDRLDSQVKIRGYRIELGEIESVAQKHPHVAQSVVVVRDDASGGKSLIACYKALAGEPVRPAELREYLQKFLPAYMVPPNLVEVDNFPLTPNGKVDRKALAALESHRRLQSSSSQGDGASRCDSDQTTLTSLESTLCSWCREILGLAAIGPSDDFFEIGGHSLAAAQLINRIAKEYGTQLKLSILLHERSMRALASRLHHPAAEARTWTPVVPLRTRGSGSPVFLIAGLGGNVLNFEPVSHAVANRPVYGVETHGLNKDGQILTSVEDMARIYLEEMQRVQPHGPYHIAGYSFGGILAFEMAQQLRRAGYEVGLLGLIDTVEWHYAQIVLASMPLVARLDVLYGDTVKQLIFGPDRSQTLIKRLNASLDHYRLSFSRLFGREPKQSAATIEHRNYYALTRYYPEPYDGNIHLFRCPDQARLRGKDPLLGWGALSGHVAIVNVAGEHETVLSEPYVESFSTELRSTLAALEQRDNTNHPEMRCELVAR